MPVGVEAVDPVRPVGDEQRAVARDGERADRRELARAVPASRTRAGRRRRGRRPGRRASPGRPRRPSRRDRSRAPGGSAGRPRRAGRSASRRCTGSHVAPGAVGARGGRQDGREGRARAPPRARAAAGGEAGPGERPSPHPEHTEADKSRRNAVRGRDLAVALSRRRGRRASRRPRAVGRGAHDRILDGHRGGRRRGGAGGLDRPLHPVDAEAAAALDRALRDPVGESTRRSAVSRLTALISKLGARRRRRARGGQGPRAR